MMPQVLPLERAKVWERWQGVGRPVRLDLAMSRETQSAAEALSERGQRVMMADDYWK